MSKTWRQSCSGLIAQVIREHKSLPLKDIKKALRNAYPFGQRKRHPYKIWCDEVSTQLGTKKKKIKQNKENNPNQTELL